MSEREELSLRLTGVAAARELCGLTLAYIGDGVYEMRVRDYLLKVAAVKPAKLHKMALKMVCATAQFEAYKKIAPLLSEEEQAIFTRGRNARVTGGKSKDPVTHCHATGLEALFGFLHIAERESRIDELFSAIVG